MKLSVVVPTLNEAETLPHTLAALPRDAEVVVADGGSGDETVAIASRHGARVVPGGRGRAQQMNRGAEATTGDVLVFVHSDCVLGAGAAEAIRSACSDPKVVGGSFRLRIANAGLRLRLVAFGSNLRARFLKMPYGDQGIFVRRPTFLELGGFPEIPFMEDVALVRKLRKRGRLVHLDVPLTTGPRHWEPLGTLATTLVNWTVVGLYFAGVSPERLLPYYLRLRGGLERTFRSEQPLRRPGRKRRQEFS